MTDTLIHIIIIIIILAQVVQMLRSFIFWIQFGWVYLAFIQYGLATGDIANNVLDLAVTIVTDTFCRTSHMHIHVGVHYRALSQRWFVVRNVERTLLDVNSVCFVQTHELHSVCATSENISRRSRQLKWAVSEAAALATGWVKNLVMSSPVLDDFVHI